MGALTRGFSISCPANVQLSRTVGVMEASQFQLQLNLFANSVGKNFENIRFLGRRSPATSSYVLLKGYTVYIHIFKSTRCYSDTRLCKSQGKPLLPHPQPGTRWGLVEKSRGFDRSRIPEGVEDWEIFVFNRPQGKGFGWGFVMS